jgi:hypothetical protein
LTTITLKDGEYITRIEGRYKDTVRQLAFTTNKGNHFGPLGSSDGDLFAIDQLCVRGFTGRSGTMIDLIGAIGNRA